MEDLIKIIKFINKHHVAIVCTNNNNELWAFNCFYSFYEENTSIIFLSDDNTKHISNILHNNSVAASIVLETKIIYKIQGLQIQGTVFKTTESAKQNNYIKRFPYAMIANTSFWELKINNLKLTDNSLGFGKKIYWERQ